MALLLLEWIITPPVSIHLGYCSWGLYRRWVWEVGLDGRNNVAVVTLPDSSEIFEQLWSLDYPLGSYRLVRLT